MKNTDSSGKHFNRELLNVWLVRGAKVLLTAFIAGLGPFVFDIYNDVRDLQAHEKIQDVKINSVKVKQSSISTKIDDLHWYLIRKNDVKINKKE